ncbi:MAG: EamA family transporter [Collinsella sp.]
MGFAAQAAPTMATGRRPALAGVASYLFYYKAISKIGAARGMALNSSYSAWAVILGIALGNVPGPLEIGCCVLILAGTVLAACDWNELFGKTEGR